MKVNVTAKGGLIDITGLTEQQFNSIVNSLLPSAQGYLALKDLTFQQKKDTFFEIQPELKDKSNSELRKEFDRQLEFGKCCYELINTLQGNDETEPVENNEAKVISINS